jgi:hypothetical protein
MGAKAADLPQNAGYARGNSWTEAMDLARQFDQAMFDIYRRAEAEIAYRPTLFLNMLHERGGVQTAKTLINAAKPSDGYTRLYEANRLDLTVEAVVIDNPKWHPLFVGEELAKARRRLKQYGYAPKTL